MYAFDAPSAITIVLGHLVRFSIYSGNNFCRCAPSLGKNGVVNLALARRSGSSCCSTDIETHFDGSEEMRAIPLASVELRRAAVDADFRLQ
jgi:hypothetical protein